jgi:transposase
LHVVVTVDAPDIVQTDTVIGIDLGLSPPAVTSTNQFLGEKAWRVTAPVFSTAAPLAVLRQQERQTALAPHQA